MGKFGEAIARMKNRDPELGDKDRSTGMDEDTTVQRNAGAAVGKLKPIPPGGRGRRNPTYGNRRAAKGKRGRDLASKL